LGTGWRDIPDPVTIITCGCKKPHFEIRGLIRQRQRIRVYIHPVRSVNSALQNHITRCIDRSAHLRNRSLQGYDVAGHSIERYYNRVLVDTGVGSLPRESFGHGSLT